MIRRRFVAVPATSSLLKGQFRFCSAPKDETPVDMYKRLSADKSTRKKGFMDNVKEYSYKKPMSATHQRPSGHDSGFVSKDHLVVPVTEESSAQFLELYESWAKQHNVAPGADFLEGTTQAYCTLGHFVQYAMKRLSPQKLSEIPNVATKVIYDDIWSQFVSELALGATGSNAPAAHPSKPVNNEKDGGPVEKLPVKDFTEVLDARFARDMAYCLELFYDRELFKLTSKLDDFWHFGTPVSPGIIAMPNDLVTSSRLVSFAFVDEEKAAAENVEKNGGEEQSGDSDAKAFVEKRRRSLYVAQAPDVLPHDYADNHLFPEGHPPESDAKPIAGPISLQAKKDAEAATKNSDAAPNDEAVAVDTTKPPLATEVFATKYANRGKRDYVAHAIVRMRLKCPPRRFHDDYQWVYDRMDSWKDDKLRADAAQYICAIKASKVLKVFGGVFRMFTGKQLKIHSQTPVVMPGGATIGSPTSSAPGETGGNNGDAKANGSDGATNPHSHIEAYFHKDIGMVYDRNAARWVVCSIKNHSEVFTRNGTEVVVDINN